MRSVSHIRRPSIVHGRLRCFQYDCPPGGRLYCRKVSIVIIISSHYAPRFMGSCNFRSDRLDPRITRNVDLASLSRFDVRRNFADRGRRRHCLDAQKLK